MPRKERLPVYLSASRDHSTPRVGGPLQRKSNKMLA